MSIFRLKGASGAVINQAFVVDDAAVIGSADDCDLQVQSDTVPPYAARITRVGDQGLELTVMEDAADIELNGETVSSATLYSGDELRIGNCRWVVQAPGRRPERVLTPEAVQRPSAVGRWLWIVVIAGAAGAAMAYAWHKGYLVF